VSRRDSQIELPRNRGQRQRRLLLCKRGSNADARSGMTPYRHGGAARNSPARELACFRPKTDGDSLVAIAEIIVLKHLGLVPGVRAFDGDPAARAPASPRPLH